MNKHLTMVILFLEYHNKKLENLCSYNNYYNNNFSIIFIIEKDMMEGVTLLGQWCD
jgi:hypothetical protein